MNLLVTTLGTTWAVAPELLGFTNADRLPLYRNHPDAANFAGFHHPPPEPGG